MKWEHPVFFLQDDNLFFLGYQAARAQIYMSGFVNKMGCDPLQLGELIDSHATRARIYPDPTACCTRLKNYRYSDLASLALAAFGRDLFSRGNFQALDDPC